MVKTLRYSIGKTNDDPKSKLKKIDEFDDMITQELDNRQNVIDIQTIITNDGEEIMIATLGDRWETRNSTSIGTVVIILILIIITIKIWSL